MTTFNKTTLFIGMDVGSTTVKSVVVDPTSDTILWQDYQRHETKQPEKVLEFLTRIEKDLGLTQECFRIFITGSGGSGLASFLGAKFVQEVNAVSLAVEKLYPNTGSVVELGGQDAKIIIFKEDPETGRKKKIPTMNDKCAGGTGAVIDKINAKLKIPAADLQNQGYTGLKLHPVAGKCGVFAETDINGLQKQGVPRDELMASLFEAIIQQNLSVLTRGHILRPEVLLLGGPNTFIRGMLECWKENIPQIWKEREYPIPEGVDPQSLIKVPENAQYFAALGSVEFGKDETPDVGQYRGYDHLKHFVEVGRSEMKKTKVSERLYKSEEELSDFLEKYTKEPFTPVRFSAGEVVEGFIGLDGGSTSTKGVLLNKNREILTKAYQLSKGNPIQDTIEIFGELQKHVTSQGASLKILGVGTTGYAKDVLRDTLAADVALVETVAHTESALHFYSDVDVICDVGGQDIKVIILHDRKVKDFKLNTQCSAGNGYFLQGTCESFGFDVRKFADLAFKAEGMPSFGYGCAVFMQSDIVDFQRQGWKPEEIMAGLAAVLPKNIWLYVCQIPNLAKLGRNFILQGGTQHNLAAVKSQVDFIKSRFRASDGEANIRVHKHCGESGAIGAAIEAVRLFENGKKTGFIGLDAVEKISYATHRNEDTRCHFCKNKCLRTFIDIQLPKGMAAAKIEERPASKIPIGEGVKRLIVGNSCERGLVEDVESMKVIKKGMDAVRKANPNLVEIAAKEVWKSFGPARVADPTPKFALTQKAKERVRLMKNRENLRIGIPRALNMYSTMPFFSGYFESLGVPWENLVYSDFTSEKLYKEGAKRGSVDPCFPSKVSMAHVHDLLFVKHKKKPLDVIFFPMIYNLLSPLVGVMENKACPTVATTPEAVKAGFTKEGDEFAKAGVKYLNTFIHLKEPNLLAKNMLEDFGPILGLSEKENRLAVEEGYKALDKFNLETLQGKGREILKTLEEENRIGIVLLGRPYHNDPGLNHEILEELQRAGYPVLTQDSLPMDDDILEELFGEEVRQGIISHPLDISDVWKNSYSENTNRKIWGSKFTARHPNLVALELSNFKCGHDAPIYSVIEEIVEKSGTPYFSFKDIDENKPTGSIKIRIETISYFLSRYREDLVREKEKRAMIEDRLRRYEEELRNKRMEPSQVEEAASV